MTSFVFPHFLVEMLFCTWCSASSSSSLPPSSLPSFSFLLLPSLDPFALAWGTRPGFLATRVPWALCLLFSPRPRVHGPVSWPQVSPEPVGPGEFHSHFFLFFFRASGEAILGTQRYFAKQFLIDIFSCLRRRDFRYPTILCKAISCYFFASLARQF